jgi:hypothetical protein
MPKKEHIKYNEGQWFVVPLRKDGFIIGVIVRGSYETKGGLGYFFGTKYHNLPDDQAIWQLKPEDAVLVTQFGDLGIINGRWPLLHTSRPFKREDWPVPIFGRRDPLIPNIGHIVEYKESQSGELEVLRERIVDVKDIIGLPKDTIRMGGSIEIVLSNLIENE